jgi:hypothetical protein
MAPITSQRSASVSGSSQRPDTPHANGAQADRHEPNGDTHVDPFEEVSAALQKQFDLEMSTMAKGRGHAAVNVLLLQWEPDGPGYLDTREEVCTSSYHHMLG